MNREILFRGKRLDNGEWVYGYLRAFDDGSYHITAKVERNVARYIDGKPFYTLYGVEHEVDPETVGQYTGLKDKNGVKIWEGDIVRCKELTREKLVEYTSVVFWDEYSFLVEDTNGCWSGLGLFTDDPTKYPLTEVNVIGTIHDNPELLEVE